MKSLGWENTESTMGDERYLIGRQPILNRREEIVAYELLFRSTESQTASIGDASQATASVIVNTLTGFGIEKILGDHKGFLNLELELLMDDSLNILPKNQVVLELLETLRVTPELIERCRTLKENGFTLALDDHAYTPSFHELYQIADIVKVDLIQNPIDQLEEMVKQFSRYSLQLLAEKVETEEEFRRCLELGFDLFQGFYFAKPAIMEKKRLGYSGSSLKNLMRLLNEDAELSDIQKACRGNLGLTDNLQMLVNSIGICSLDNFDSESDAISILGREQVKRWVQLALVAG